MGMIVFGWIGWWIGAKFGGFMTAFLVSSIGSIVGVYVGWRINRDYLSRNSVESSRNRQSISATQEIGRVLKKRLELFIRAEAVCSPPEACGDKLSRFRQYAIGV